MNLFDLIELPKKKSAWRPPEFPDLSRVDEVEVNFETTGLRWWEDDHAIALVVGWGDRADYQTAYLPWEHAGGNLPKEQVIAFAQRELRDKHLRNSNIRFDIQMGRKDGIDFEEQNCTVHDIGHDAALLDDHRIRFGIDALADEFLGGALYPRVDESHMASYHAGDVARRACHNLELVRSLHYIFQPMIEEQELTRVQALEDKVIYTVCEMERNGAPIDHELLQQWIKRSKKELDTLLMEVGKEAGFQVNPGSSKDLQRVFEKLKLPIEKTIGTELHPEGQASFTDTILKRIEHPLVAKIRRAGKLTTLRSKYLLKYEKAVDSKGIYRYALHQLRAVKDDDGDAGEVGTVTGRFSSTKILSNPDVGGNIQQERKVEKQRVAWGIDEDDSSHDEEIYIIRRLRVPDRSVHAEAQWLSADAKQIEYRIFASYVGNQKILDAYAVNPNLHFHKHVQAMLAPYVKLTYGRTKDCNFAKVYGAGLKKLALMMGFISQEQFEELKRQKAKWNHPLLAETVDINAIYDRELSGSKELLKKATSLAETRHYVCTILGRRSRFPNGFRAHKAFNSIDQGSAADIMKQKLVELHAERKTTGFLLRYTVHDEVDGDAQSPETKARVAEILDRQSFPSLKVPILWDVKTGRNWAECA